MSTNLIRYMGAAVMAAGTLVASLVLAEDKSAPSKPAKMEEMMKKAEAAGTPGAAHKALDPLVGRWTAEVKCWMAPDAPPTVTKATANSSWIMNGRFEVIRIIGPDSHIFEMHDPSKGDHSKTMEITYTRVGRGDQRIRSSVAGR